MEKNEKLSGWWLFFFIPVLFILSVSLISFSLLRQSDERQPKKIAPEFYAVETGNRNLAAILLCIRQIATIRGNLG